MVYGKRNMKFLLQKYYLSLFYVLELNNINFNVHVYHKNNVAKIVTQTTIIPTNKDIILKTNRREYHYVVPLTRNIYL